ncbi:hypothetical protein DVR01_02295 [Limosilactobacillus fermentum]|uniref:hypothetical protein n=1 Tax=Limosilactobacillus fermentum TaxID=1613 RepID=UPI000F0C0C67|nr:hypothetical protein [Limosilactobacillus fermentum]AYP98297.1 hypothetical protein DVR01_02295 [Limosilactobacillus fermentum]
MRFDDRLQIEDKAYIDEFGEPDFERETQKFNRRLRAIENLRKSDDQLERERLRELEMAKRKGVIDGLRTIFLAKERKLASTHKGTSEFPELWDMLLEWKIKRKLTLADTTCISKRSFKTVKNELHKAAARKKRAEEQ